MSQAVTQMYEPPLLRFLRMLDGDEKEAFAKAVGTTYYYIFQLVGQAEPNPTLKLALAIEAETHRLGRQLGIEPVSLSDLLIGRIKTKQAKDHTTGEVFALLPNGDLVLRRLDKQGRIVLVDGDGRILGIEDSNPGPHTLKKVRPLDDE